MSSRFRPTDVSITHTARVGTLDELKAGVRSNLSRGTDISMHLSRTLAAAAEGGKLDSVKYLESLGANIHANKDDALRVAITNGHADVATYLFSKGASIKDLQKDKPRFGILDAVVRSGNFAILKLIVNRGANIYANGESALRIAVFAEQRYILDYLLAQSIRNKKQFRTIPDLIQESEINGSPPDIVERLRVHCQNTLQKQEQQQQHERKQRQMLNNSDCAIL